MKMRPVSQVIARLVKKYGKKCVAMLSKRNPLFLPRASYDEANYLSVKYDYRVQKGRAVVKIAEEKTGRLILSLSTTGSSGRHDSCRAIVSDYDPRHEIHIDFKNGKVLLKEKIVAEFRIIPGNRRYQLAVQLEDATRKTLRRTCSFYTPETVRPIDKDYFTGSNYLDYEKEAAGDAVSQTAWLGRWIRSGRVLEIGCGTGLSLEQFGKLGFDCYGVDVSGWAVEQAASRVGKEKVAVCDIEKSPVPFPGPFDLLFMSAVFEHLREPYDALARLAPLTKEGTVLFIRTANSESLTRFLFNRDWEGYFDYTHFGIDKVSVSALRQKIPALGWKILSLETDSVWAGGDDDTVCCLREFAGNDARFRKLLKERNLGDFLSLVAEKVN